MLFLRHTSPITKTGHTQFIRQAKKEKKPCYHTLQSNCKASGSLKLCNLVKQKQHLNKYCLTISCSTPKSVTVRMLLAAQETNCLALACLDGPCGVSLVAYVHFSQLPEIYNQNCDSCTLLMLQRCCLPHCLQYILPSACLTQARCLFHVHHLKLSNNCAVFCR